MSIDRQINDIAFTDLKALVAAEVREGKTMEYKEQVSIENDTVRRKFVASVASFANASGGDIVYGIKAEKGVPKDIVPLLNFDPDKDIRTLRDIIRAHIDPPLFGVEFKEVQVDGGFALVLRVPRGWGGAHMVTYGDDNRFYTRDANGRVLMNVPEIRAAFTRMEAVADRVRRFRFERLSLLKSGELLPPIAQGPKWVLHILPLSAFENKPPCNLDRVAAHRSFQPVDLESVRSCGVFHDLDGVYAYGLDSRQSTNAYSAVLRNGCVEATHCFGYGSNDIPNPGLEQELLGAHARAIAWLPLVNMEPPAIVAVSLLNVKGRTLYCTPNRPIYDIRAIRQDDLLLHDVLDRDCQPTNPANVLRPAFDAIWQACGKERSQNFNDDGEWRPQSWF